MKKRRILEYLCLFVPGFSLKWALDQANDLSHLVFVEEPTLPSHDFFQTLTKKQEAKHQPYRYPTPLIATNSSIQFVFVVGLEGTGHHLMGAIARRSPAVKKLRGLGIFPHKTAALQNALFDGKNSTGLWNVHCDPQQQNITEIQHRVIDAMRAIQSSVKRNTSNSAVISFPVNTVPTRLTGEYGEASFPNFFGECRRLNYPSLDLFYDACDMARVECRHVYLFRDAYEVLYSTTTKRGFNPNLLFAIHMYTSMLKIIATELRGHASRGIGCFGFYEQKNDVSSMDWWDPIRILWGWNNDTEGYETFMKSIYKQPRQSANHSFVPKSLDPYMKMFVKNTLQVIRICKESTGVQR
jgi:hypothetical protein